MNPSDVLSVQGLYPGFEAKTLPASPGQDGTGIVEAVGEGVEGFAVGDRVSGAPLADSTGEGSYREYASIPSTRAVKVPEGVDPFQAGQFFINPVTAYMFFDLFGRLGLASPGDYVINNAASSQLGRMVTRLGTKLGYKMIAVVRNAKWVDRLIEAGAVGVVVSSDEDVADAVRELTGGEGASVALDPVLGPMTVQIGQALKVGGTILAYGVLGGLEATISAIDLLFRGIVVRGAWINTYVRSILKDDAERKEVFDKVMKLIAEGVLTAEIGEAFTLEQGKEALAAESKPGRETKVYFVSE